MKNFCYSLSIILSVTFFCVTSNSAVAESTANVGNECFEVGRRDGDNLFSSGGRGIYCYDYGTDGWGFSQEGYQTCRVLSLGGEGCFGTTQQVADFQAGCFAQLTTDCINNRPHNVATDSD